MEGSDCKQRHPFISYYNSSELIASTKVISVYLESADAYDDATLVELLAPFLNIQDNQNLGHENFLLNPNYFFDYEHPSFVFRDLENSGGYMQCRPKLYGLFNYSSITSVNAKLGLT
ncbi:hypothetical protein Y032_0095g2862 [Ancylostoma ceylanicum]|uniref:Uncharacterized protein n=1 Tax=Ancylostoma ceylanicum TaxID=53326 RepID=A0A016TKX2_9BILA|nr:hypothetical protein Y032_0095g2862 [Ancylostoma ceylanicum]